MSDSMLFGGVSLLELAKEYGTPLYVYDEDAVMKHYNDLHDYIKWGKLHIHYAMKANYNFDILKRLNAECAYLDTVSPGEILLAQKAGFTSDRILYTANNMTDAEVREVHASGVLLNIGSLSRLEKYGKEFSNSRICIRFNPDVVDGAHEKIMTGGDLTKFGILLKDIEKVKTITKKYNLTVVGIHEHTGSGLQLSESVYQSMKNIMQIATFANFPDLEFLDFGGGFKVPYEPKESRINYIEMGKQITHLFSKYCNSYGKELCMIFEPGKYIVAEAGCLLVEVNTLKNNNGRIIAGCNSGFPQLIRPMFYDAYHHIHNVSNPKGKLAKYDICGNICETGDRFAEQRELPEIREGDILVIENAGAYCYTMGGVYNLRPMPPEVIIRDGKHKLSRKGLTSTQLVDLILSETI